MEIIVPAGKQSLPPPPSAPPGVEPGVEPVPGSPEPIKGIDEAEKVPQAVEPVSVTKQLREDRLLA